MIITHFYFSQLKNGIPKLSFLILFYMLIQHINQMLCYKINILVKVFIEARKYMSPNATE